MEDSEIDEMLHQLLEEIDHDIAKFYQAETTEDLEEMQERMEILREIVRSYL